MELDQAKQSVGTLIALQMESFPDGWIIPDQSNASIFASIVSGLRQFLLRHTEQISTKPVSVTAVEVFRSIFPRSFPMVQGR